MRQPHIDDFVRLTRDIPELSLQCGEVGVVRATWFAPATAYEVEFHPAGLTYERRALLVAECLEVQADPQDGKPARKPAVDSIEWFESQHVLG